MLRKRKLSLAGIAVGALALTVSTSVPLAYGHGYTNSPISRAKLCQNGTVQNCGQIQWETAERRRTEGLPGLGAGGRSALVGGSNHGGCRQPRARL